MERLDCSVVVKVKDIEKAQNSCECYLNDISSATEPSVTKLGMVMQRHGPEYHARRLLSSSSGSQ